MYNLDKSMASWQTIRLRNADGTSTVYRVHDSENTNHNNIVHSFSMSARASPSLPPEVILGGSTEGRNIHHYGHYGSPMPTSSMDSTAFPHYGHNITTLHSAHGTQSRSQTPLVILKPTKKRTRSKCAKNCSTSNNLLCITCGVILSLLVIIGYVSLIVVLIPGSTKNRWNEEVEQPSMASIAAAEGGAGNNSRQKLLSNQDLKQIRASIGTTSSSSAVDGAIPIIPRGHSYNAIVTILDPADEPQPNNNDLQAIDQSQERRKVAKDAGEPVRRLRRRKQKRKLV